MALDEVTPQAAQGVELSTSLDALGNTGDLHVVARARERLDDLVAHGIVVDVGDEAAVDLDLVERQPVHVAQ